MGVKLCENTVVELKVLRISDVGAFLDGQTGNTNDDILLHKNQQIHPVQQGDTVRVFLYHDPSGRLTASRICSGHQYDPFRSLCRRRYGTRHFYALCGNEGSPERRRIRMG